MPLVHYFRLNVGLVFISLLNIFRFSSSIFWHCLYRSMEPMLFKLWVVASNILSLEPCIELGRKAELLPMLFIRSASPKLSLLIFYSGLWWWSTDSFVEPCIEAFDFPQFVAMVEAAFGSFQVEEMAPLGFSLMTDPEQILWFFEIPQVFLHSIYSFLSPFVEF